MRQVGFHRICAMPYSPLKPVRKTRLSVISNLFFNVLRKQFVHDDRNCLNLIQRRIEIDDTSQQLRMLKRCTSCQAPEWRLHCPARRHALAYCLCSPRKNIDRSRQRRSLFP